MKIPGFIWLSAALLAGAFAFPSISFADLELGDPPRAPTDLSGLPGGGPRPPSVTGGFTVNTDSREEVRSFYVIYKSSSDVPMDTTANVSTCTPGTNSTAFKEAVLRRINWFRAMAGIPASVTLNSVNSAKNQEAALMMSAANALSHTPANTWPCYTVNGADAAGNSNLALGSDGPDSISGYIQDPGSGNTAGGHRRWILYPQTQIMGTGDVPQQGTNFAANATWVFDANYGGPRPATRKPYVSWPPAGYVPYPVVYPRWSLGLSNADLSVATVSMKSNGVSVSVALESYQTGAGENTLVWVPMGLDASSFATVFPFNGTDTVYSVTVTNVKYGLITTGYTYTVTLFDPAVPGADYFPPTISGPSQPTVGQNNAYTFTAVSNATSYQWRSALRTPYNLTDGAESGLGNFIVNTSAGYSVQDASVHASGSYSFHLAHPSPTDQTLTLNQTLSPATNTVLTFKSRLGFATSSQTAKVQISADSGSSWTDLYSQSGTGGQGETTFSSHSMALSNYTGTVVQLRFNYSFGGGTYFPQTSAGVGWYIDDLAIANAELLAIQGTNSTGTTNFTFNPSQTGTYSLQARAFLFTEFALDWGPAKTVTAVSNGIPTPYILMRTPVISNAQVRLDFTVTNAAVFSFKLLQADLLTGPWTTNGSATLTTNVPGSSYRFTTSTGPAARFFRVQTP